MPKFFGGECDPKTICKIVVCVIIVAVIVVLMMLFCKNKKIYKEKLSEHVNYGGQIVEGVGSQVAYPPPSGASSTRHRGIVGTPPKMLSY